MDKQQNKWLAWFELCKSSVKNNEMNGASQQKFIHFVAACSLIVFLLSSCGGSQSNDRFFHYNEVTGIASLDPAFAKNQSIMWAVHQLYNTLVETDSNLNLVPSLAKSWEISADKKTFIFHLRTDVFFHDHPVFANGIGRKMMAADVAYSLRRIMDKQTASSGAWIFNDRVDLVNGFKVIDDSTFQLQLIRPFNPIIGILSMQYCSIVPHEAVEKFGKDFRRNPIGTGPFVFKAWEEGQALLMQRNPKYFEHDAQGNALPYLEGIKVSFLDSRATEFLEFQQGRLDFINDIDPSFKDEVLNKKGDLKKDWQSKLDLKKSPYLNIEYLGILVDSTNELVKNSPLRMRKVRQAMNYAFDRKKMMLYLRNSIGTAATSGFVPAGLPSFDSTKVKGYDYDIVKAKQLLSEAGFPNGKGLPQIKLMTIPNYADLASFIAKELEEVGFAIQVDAMQKSLLLELTSNSKALLFRGSWIADYPDAENYLSVFYSKNPAPPNYTRYRNLVYDQLYDQSMLETNDSLKQMLYQQMDQMLINDAPVIPLWYDMALHLVQKRIAGFSPNGLNLLELRRTQKN